MVGGNCLSTHELEVVLKVRKVRRQGLIEDVLRERESGLVITHSSFSKCQERVCNTTPYPSERLLHTEKRGRTGGARLEG